MTLTSLHLSVQSSWLQSAHTARAPPRAMLLALDPVHGTHEGY